MKISLEDAQRMSDIAREMQELCNEFNDMARAAMSNDEYERFKYNCLAHLEPGLMADHHWLVTSVSLEEVAENAIDEAEEEEEND